MKKLLWLMVVFVLVPISMIISEVNADFNNAPEVKNGRRQIYLELPKELEDKYVKVGDKDEWLTTLDVTVVNNRAVVRLVKAKNLRIKRSGHFAQDMKVRLVAIFCICMKHNNTGGFKLVIIEKRTADGWERVYDARLKKDYKENPKGWS